MQAAATSPQEDGPRPHQAEQRDDESAGEDIQQDVADEEEYAHLPYGTTASLPSLLMRNSKATPGPGYVWDDNVNKRRVPHWTFMGAERQHLDLMMATWTPASLSLQPRAPDPGEYGDVRLVGRRGKHSSPQWSFGSASKNCLDNMGQGESSGKIYMMPHTVGSQHPTHRASAKWSLYGQDRSSLPMNIKTWTPHVVTDIRPGPGQYNLDRAPKWKAKNRRGCTWGARTPNLHQELPAWLPATKGTRLTRGEWSRMRKPVNHPWNCSCKVCPGPGLCKDLHYGA